MPRSSKCDEGVNDSDGDRSCLNVKEDKKKRTNDDSADEFEKTVISKTIEKSLEKKKNSKTREREDAKKKITLEEIDDMRVIDLQEWLQKFGLSTVGKKVQLKDRLKKVVRLYLEDEDDDIIDTQKNDSEESEEDYGVLEDESDDEEEINSNRRQMRLVRRTNSKSSKFTIRDVEDSIAHFSGDDALSVKKWISDFEDLATLLEWDDLQKLIYGKRMLQGSARKFVTYETGITKWSTLKRRLLVEFKPEVNSAIVHARLMKRKRKSEESGRQYVYAMQEIASQGCVEDEALIQYIIDGVADEEINKSILYGAQTIHELKKKIEIYDRIKENSNLKKQVKKYDGKDGKKTALTKKAHGHCFNCGSVEHAVGNCPSKDKGPKCFRCNKFGHISSKCTESITNGQKKHNVACISSTINRSVLLEINGAKCDAFIDNGSDVNLMSQQMYIKIGSPTLDSTVHVLMGLGGTEVKPIGVFYTNIMINNETYSVRMFVVPASTTSYAVIIGYEFLKHVDVSIRRGIVEIKRLPIDDKIQLIDETNIKEKSDEIGEDCELAELRKVNCIVVNEVDVSGPYKKEVEKLIAEYQPKKQVHTNIETKIRLTCNKPIYHKPRRLAPKEKKILDDQVSEWLATGIIRPSTSEYTSPVVVTPKKDGSYRVCIDYRRLNKNIERDHFPMPLIDDCLDSLSDARIFSVLDLKNGFFHVPVEANSQKYTSFITPDGQYEFIRTPFGLCNSPASFLRFVNHVFHDLIKMKVLKIYMDDLIVPGIDDEDALQKLITVLKTSAEHGLIINWKKCHFLKRRVEFLGHVIENGCIAPTETKIKAVRAFHIPKTTKDIQSFLGLTGYFRKFIKDYALIARPLSNLLRKDQQFRFGKEEEASFQALKNKLTNEPVLRIYNPKAVTELHTDASKEGYGGVLMQKLPEEKHFRPVHYMSCKTTDAEKKLHSYELEVMAVIKALKKLRVYLLGVKFKIVTDCQAFEKTMNKKDMSPKIARWAIGMQEFDYEMEHRPGVRMKHVDALSRYPVMLLEDTLMKVIAKQQDQEERLHVIKQVLKTEPYGDYVLEDGLLKKNVGGVNVIVLPTTMQTDIIRRVHGNGHFGVKKMMEEIQQEFYIDRLHEKLDRFVHCCISCVLSEKKRGKKEGYLKPIPKGNVPLHTYHLDHQGPMSSTSKLYKYLFVVIDAFTKFVWIYPTKTLNTNEVIDRLNNQQKTFGNPHRFITDKGGAFKSDLFKEYCVSEGIEHSLITTGVPRGNGQVERINGIIVPVLTKASLEEPEKWYKNVHEVQMSLNSTFQRSIGMTPFEALIGTKMRHKSDTRISSIIEQEVVQLYDEHRDQLRAIAKENILKIQEENRKTHNKKCKEAIRYKEGDLVAIEKIQYGPGQKVMPKFLGPYEVIKAKGNERYDVVKVGNGEGPGKTTSAADYMKPFPSGSEVLSGEAECENDEFKGWSKEEISHSKCNLKRVAKQRQNV